MLRNCHGHKLSSEMLQHCHRHVSMHCYPAGYGNTFHARQPSCSLAFAHRSARTPPQADRRLFSVSAPHGGDEDMHRAARKAALAVATFSRPLSRPGDTSEGLRFSRYMPGA